MSGSLAPWQPRTDLRRYVETPLPPLPQHRVALQLDFLPGANTTTATLDLPQGDLYLDGYVVTGVPTLGGLPTYDMAIINTPRELFSDGTSNLSGGLGLDLPLENSARTVVTLGIPRFIKRLAQAPRLSNTVFTVVTPALAAAALTRIVLYLRVLPLVSGG